MSFSMCTAEVINELQEHRNENIIICGIESHVCVLQTVLALHVHDRRLKIYVVCDAISSRRYHICVHEPNKIYASPGLINGWYCSGRKIERWHCNGCPGLTMYI